MAHHDPSLKRSSLREGLLDRRGVLGLAATSTLSLVAGNARAASPRLGKPAPRLEIDLLSGKPFVLADAKEKVILIDFWATWCSPCKLSFEFYERLLRASRGSVGMVALSVDESPREVAQFVKATGVTFPIAWDKGQKWANVFAPEAMPTLYVLDGARNVRFVHSGFRRSDETGISESITSLVRS